MVIAVYSDKEQYHKEMKKVLERQENLTLRQGEVAELIVEEFLSTDFEGGRHLARVSKIAAGL